MTTPAITSLPLAPAAARAARLRLAPAALLLGCAVAALGTAAWAAAAPGAPGARVADADLARLLRLMALVKGALVVAGALAFAWRLRRPAAPWRVAAYVTLAWGASAAVGAMWSLAAVGLTAVVMHAAGVAALAVAWYDPDFFPAPTPQARSVA